MAVNSELEEKAVKAIRDYIHGDYGLPLYTADNSFIRLADLAKGKDRLKEIKEEEEKE